MPKEEAKAPLAPAPLLLAPYLPWPCCAEVSALGRAPLPAPLLLEKDPSRAKGSIGCVFLALERAPVEALPWLLGESKGEEKHEPSAMRASSVCTCCRARAPGPEWSLPPIPELTYLFLSAKLISAL